MYPAKIIGVNTIWTDFSCISPQFFLFFGNAFPLVNSTLKNTKWVSSYDPQVLEKWLKFEA